MKKLLNRLFVTCGLLLAFATVGRAEESHRGFYEADLASGGKAIFFVQGNQALSVYLFQVASSTASFAGGTIAADGTFSVTTSSGVVVSGALRGDDDSGGFDDDLVSATVGGQAVTASRISAFGPSDDIPGRFVGTARSADGSSLDLKLVVDSQNRIFLIAVDGASVLGGFGTVSVVSTSSKAQHGDDDPPGDDRGHGADDDIQQDLNEDNHDLESSATFSLTLLSGEHVTGSLTFGHDSLFGDFTLAGVSYSFFSSRESSGNKLANISTRGFVSTGQGQLIGGFIVIGGPKMVVIRALGPSLASQGVSPVLANPVLTLLDGNTVVASNDDWQSASNSDDIVATTIPPENPNEATILVRLEPGAYTAVVAGANDTTGIALIEVYGLDHD